MATPYCTDEQVRIRVGADFEHLCPKDQLLADGTDGLFTVSDRWTLVSASADFPGQGVAADMVVKLSTRIATGTSSPFGAGGSSLAVASCSADAPNELVLRRLGQAEGAGQPPGPIAGATSVIFSVATLGPQIEDASYRLDRQFGVDPQIPGRTPADFWDLREVREVCVLKVAYRQYLAMARSANATTPGDFWDKARSYKDEHDEVLAGLVVHWRNRSGFGAEAVEPSTSRFATRLSR